MPKSSLALGMNRALASSRREASRAMPADQASEAPGPTRATPISAGISGLSSSGWCPSLSAAGVGAERLLSKPCLAMGGPADQDGHHQHLDRGKAEIVEAEQYRRHQGHR